MASPSAPHPETKSFALVNNRSQIHSAESMLLEAIDRFGYAKAARFAIRLAFEEAVTNAFKHGHKGLPPTTPIQVELIVNDQSVQISIEDQGPGFNPSDVPDPTLDENLEVPTGRGLMLIRAYMSDITFNDAGNRVTMTFERDPNASV